MAQILAHQKTGKVKPYPSARVSGQIHRWPRVRNNSEPNHKQNEEQNSWLFANPSCTIHLSPFSVAYFCLIKYGQSFKLHISLYKQSLWIDCSPLKILTAGELIFTSSFRTPNGFRTIPIFGCSFE